MSSPSDVVETVEAMHGTGHQVFPGMVLHPLETLLPVEEAGHLCPRRDRPVAEVGDDAIVRNLYIAHTNGTGQRGLTVLLELLQGTGVRVLPAAFREEGRFVQDDRVEALPLFGGLAGDDGRGERFAGRIGVVKFFRFHRDTHKSLFSLFLVRISL